MDRIICAANLVNNHIVCGVRHYDQIMVNQMDCIDEAYSDANVLQGFVNQRGEFLTREEAWVVALAAGQIIRRVGGDRCKLFSENLY